MPFSQRIPVSSGRSPHRLECAVLALLAAVVAVELVHIIALQIGTSYPMPWADEWDSLYLFSLAEKAPGSGLGFLFYPHNEHRIAIPRLVMLLDLAVTHGSGVINLATTLIVPALTATVFWFALRRRVDRALLLTGCLACLLYAGGQMSTFVWGFQTQVVLLYFFSLLAFCCLGKAIESGQRKFYFGAAIAAICACLCQSGGLLVLPVIILLGAWHWRRAGRAGPVAITLLMALSAAFYLWGPGWSPSSLAALVSIRDQTLFAISFLGSPLALMAPPLVIPAGLMAIALSVILVVRYARIAAPRLDQTVAVSACLFILAVAVAAALSRISLGIEGATESRFVTPALFLWAGLLIGFWPFFTPRLAALCAVSVAVYSLLSHLWFQTNYWLMRDAKAMAEILYVSDVKDVERLGLFGSLKLTWPIRPFMKRHALAPFSTTVSQAVGRKLSEVYEVNAELCRGWLDGDFETVPDDQGYWLHGWSVSDRGTAPAAVLLVQGEIVVGIGRFLQERPDVLASNAGARELRVGFVGAVRDLTRPVRAYVDVRGVACPLLGEVRKAP